MKTASCTEQGNVLFYILIAVALLSALAFAVSQNSRTGIKHVSEEKTQLLATDIMDYASVIATSYSQLRLRGCKLETISFESTGNNGYVNNNSPADKTCHIFELAGGGVTYKNPAPEALTNAGDHIFTMDFEIAGVGTTCGTYHCAELIMVTGQVTENVCIKINQLLKVDNPSDQPPGEGATFSTATKFTGALDYDTTLSASAIYGKNAACIEDTDNGAFYFYKVIAAR